MKFTTAVLSVFALGCVGSIAHSAPILDDDFNGASGAVVDITKWADFANGSADLPKQNGAGRVLFGGHTAGHSMFGKSAFLALPPNAPDYLALRTTFKGFDLVNVQNWALAMGSNPPTISQFITIQTDALPGVAVRIHNGTTAGYVLGPNNSLTAWDGDWTIDYNAARVIVSLNGVPLVNTDTSVPTTGTLNMPTASMIPYGYVYTFASTIYSLDRVTLEIVALPEPGVGAVLVLGVAGVISARRARRSRR